MSVFSLWLPIVLSAVALFFASFLSWMVFKLHKADWRKVPNEDDLLDALRKANVPVGSYMLPGTNHPSEMNTPEFQKKFEQGPRAVMTVMPKVSMGTNLGLTMALFLVVSFTLAYLASIAFKPGTAFIDIFRFTYTAALLAFLTAILSHSTWFRNRIVGHVIESVAYAAIPAAILAAMWPK
jgi:hypothetical protein